ncbi:MAG TPA: helix-turn-helix domain-containing protein, partial [Bacilli bacterium]
DIMELKNKIVCFYYNNSEIDLQNILTTVTDDLGLKIKVYESGKLDIKIPEAFRILFEMYLKQSINISRMYTNNSDLILDIAKTNIKELKTLKPIILNKIYNDTQLEKLIYSMFDNNLNVTKTAQDVYMHRNTINNKLELIKQETTLNLQNFKDSVAMYLLLKF